MAIFTPRGLKIRFSKEYAFTLMSRLYPQKNAFTILKTTEGIEHIPDVFAFLTGLICFILKVEPYYIGAIVLALTVIGAMIRRYGFFFIPGIVSLGTLYSYISGFGILLIALLVVGYFLVGIQGIVAFVVGRIIAGVINYALDIIFHKSIYKKSGLILTTSEINFYNAYRIHASSLGKSLDLNVSEEEINRGDWETSFNDFYFNYPEVVHRFTED